MVDHLKTGETLGVSGRTGHPEAVALSPEDLKTAIGAGVEVPATSGTDRRVHLGISGVAATEAAVKGALAKGVEEAKGYPGAGAVNYRPEADVS